MRGENTIHEEEIMADEWYTPTCVGKTSRNLHTVIYR